MTHQSITKPNATTYALSDIVGEVYFGRIRVPDFQRSFRWQWEDVRRLFDSILKGYPIGSLLLWSRPAKQEDLKLGALNIQAPAVEEALWVVDGQQRLTSLASALHEEGSKDPRFALSFDLKNKVLAKLGEHHEHCVPLPILFDLPRLLKWFAEKPEMLEYFNIAAEIATAIRQFSIPAYIVKQQDESILRDIFDRMNNYGKRLRRAEIFNALHAGNSREDSPNSLEYIAERIDSVRGFGTIDQDTVLRAVLARRGHDLNRDIRGEFNKDCDASDLPGETPEAAYLGGEKALSHAVRFLQEEAGVPHFTFLAYRYLLVVLARFFAHHPNPSPRNRTLLRRWFWRAAIIGPIVLKSWTQAMRTLTRLVKPGDEDGNVQGLLREINSHPLKLPGIVVFRSNSAETRMLLCAMWAQKPRSFLTGEEYDNSMLAAALQGRGTANQVLHPLFKGGKNWGALASNRFFLLGEDTTEDIFNRCVSQPGETREKNQVEEVLVSQAMNAESVIYLNQGQAELFFTKRQALMESILQDFLETMTESNFEDTPPLQSLDLDEDDLTLDDHAYDETLPGFIK